MNLFMKNFAKDWEARSHKALDSLNEANKLISSLTAKNEKIAGQLADTIKLYVQRGDEVEQLRAQVAERDKTIGRLKRPVMDEEWTFRWDEEYEFEYMLRKDVDALIQARAEEK